MSRRLLAAVAIALLVTSCASSDTLATVNDVAITKADLIALDSAYEDPLGSISGDALRANVSSLIIFETAEQAAEKEFGVTLSDATIDDRVANPPDRYAGAFVDPAMSEEALRQIGKVTLLVDAVVPILLIDEYGGWDEVLTSAPDLVSGDATPSVAELAADPMAYLDLSSAIGYFNDWSAQQIAVADIEVSSVVGTWSSESMTITAPNQ